MKQTIINDVLEQMKKDFESGDLTAIEELLKSCPINSLSSYLPEGHKNYGITEPFSNRMEELKEEAFQYIKSVMEKRGTNYQLTDPENYDIDAPEYDPEVYQLPRGYANIGADGTYDEFAIVVVNIRNGLVSFEGVGISDVSEEEIFIKETLTTESIVGIADLMRKFES